jgi:hypothetical protein
MAPFGQGQRGTSLIPLLLFAFGFRGLSIGLLLFSLFRSGYALSAQSQTNCQSLIDQAISYTGKYCNQIGANQGCYGNTTIQAQMITNASQRFSERGDVADINQIQSISADPLNLMTHDWGIAIFRVLGNLPGTVPGEMVTLMVFGNTKLDKTSTGLGSFYFSSELGQIVCGKVPLDGILINMPNGAGWMFDVNGTELALTGNASLEANKNGTMVVGLYNGAGQITSDGQTQDFGAGQSVSVNLGGANGDQAVSPPSKPQSLAPEELKVACTMTGNYCRANAISTVDTAQAPAIVQSGLTLSVITDASPVPPLLSPSISAPSLPAPTTVLSLPLPTASVNRPDPPSSLIPPNTPVPSNPPGPPNPLGPPNPPGPPKPPGPPNPQGTKKCNGKGNPDCAGKGK